ncbi:hypothetical protein ACGF5M_02615 [Gemmatimonadota bacterium]
MRALSTRPVFWTCLVLLLVLGGMPISVAAQESEESTDPRPIALQDILEWKRIVGPAVSADGSWFAYRLAPSEGDGELVVRSTANDTEHRFPVGEAGGPVAFSDDSGWLAFTISPTVEAGKRTGAQRSPARNEVGLLNLASGEMTEIEDVRAFRFAGERGGMDRPSSLPRQWGRGCSTGQRSRWRSRGGRLRWRQRRRPGSGLGPDPPRAGHGTPAEHG